MANGRCTETPPGLHWVAGLPALEIFITIFTQNRVAAATAKLPEEVKRFGVSTQKSLPNILMLIALTSEGGRFGQNFLGNYALINVKDTLARIKDIVNTLFVALALVILVVFVFIQDWRAALIPTVAIPVSLVGAFIVFPMIGFSINVLSLLGLVLAIGIVVDDAIVVVEAVQVKIEEGMAPREATVEAMGEVTAPVIATTLVLVAVFIPVAVMGGITGRLYQQFAITVAVSVLFSSMNALTLSPALCSLLLRKQKPYRGPLGVFFKAFNRVFDKATDGYMWLSRKVARQITIGLIVIAAVAVGTGFLGRMVPGGFMPEEDMGYLMINVQLPDAASLQRSDVVTRKIEKILAKYDEIEYVTTATGFSALSGSMSSNAGFLFVSLKDWGERKDTANQLVARLNAAFRSEVIEAQIFAFGPPAIPGLGNGSGFTIMLQDMGGNGPEYLTRQTTKFVQAAVQRPEIASAFTTFRASVPQRFMEINRDKVLKAGIALDDIYTTVGAFLGGTYVNDFNRFGRLYKAYIQAEPRYRQNPGQINLFFVKNKDGHSAPLSAFVTIKNSAGPDFTNRFNLFRAVEITGGPAQGYSSAQALDTLEKVAAEVLPTDMGFSWSNMSYQEKKASGTGSIVFLFSLLFVFLILAAQYESWSLPFSILMGTPFAIFGAFAALLLGRLYSQSYELNTFAQIALVMLIAMAAKNAILIVEFAKLEFDKGLSLYDAAIKAARMRFRPILMTAFSFILGILPLVVATGAGAEARVVMGMALLGGMSLATLLGVFYYPMLFIFIGKIARYEQKRDLQKDQV
jgi:HAE1 family hydrophobic/amphiphilic exporter-1